MGVVINLEGEYGKELMKWEQFPRHGADGTVHQPGNPWKLREYPKMLYRAQVFPRNGKTLTAAPPVSPFGWTDPIQYQQAQLEADAFTASCQRIVKDEAEELIAKGQGWAPSQQAAIEVAEQAHAARGRAEAEERFRVQRMSEKSQAEFAAVADTTDQFITDVPAPKKRPGRPAKAVAAVE